MNLKKLKSKILAGIMLLSPALGLNNNVFAMQNQNHQDLVQDQNEHNLLQVQERFKNYIKIIEYNLFMYKDLISHNNRARNFSEEYNKKLSNILINNPEYQDIVEKINRICGINLNENISLLNLTCFLCIKLTYITNVGYTNENDMFLRSCAQTNLVTHNLDLNIFYDLNSIVSMLSVYWDNENRLNEIEDIKFIYNILSGIISGHIHLD